MVAALAGAAGCSSGGGSKDGGTDAATGDAADGAGARDGSGPEVIATDTAAPDGGRDTGSSQDATDAPGDAPPYDLPTAVQVPRASAPATLPPTTSARCFANGASAPSDTCWVLKWGKWTYWFLSDAGNSEAFYATPFDAAGALPPGGEWPKVLAGARYPWHVDVDISAMTVTIAGGGNVTVRVSWDDLRVDQPGGAGPDGGAGDGGATGDGGGDAAAPYATPTVVRLSPLSVPASRPAGSRAVCLSARDQTTSAATCPVLRWGRWTYWVLDDSRDLFVIFPVDANGATTTQAGWPLDEEGGRYLWNIEVDDTAMTVTLLGQATGSATATWAELRIDQP